jgi:hypothetical protein
MEGRRATYEVLVSKPEGKRPLLKPRQRWVDNIKDGFSRSGIVGMEWIGLAQDRQVADVCECVNEPSGSIQCRKFLNYLRTY